MNITSPQNQNWEIEKKFLSILLNSESARLKYINLLKLEDFTNPAHQQILMEIQTLFRKKKYTFDQNLFIHHLEATNKLKNIDLNFLTDLFDNYFSDKFANNYWAILITSSLKRKLHEEISLLEKSSDKNAEGDEVIAHASRMLVNLGKFYRRFNSDFFSLHDLVQKYVQTQQMLNKKQTLVCSTGFPELDMYTQGFKPGELIVIAARPSMGKTAFALSIACKTSLIANESGVEGDIVIFSLEMSDQQLGQRFASMKHFNWDFAKTNIVEETNILENLDKLKEQNIYINTAPSLDVLQIDALLSERQATHPIRLVIIDYLQLLQPLSNSKIETRNLEVSEWTRRLKLMAQKLKIPIVCLSQLSRNVERREDKRPLLSDLRDSGSIEQDADVVIFIYRENYYLSRSPEKKEALQNPHSADLIIAKNRNGPTKSFKLLFIPTRTAFEDFEETPE